MRSTVRSWMQTSSWSAVSLTSHSRPSAPWSSASSYAARVCSGACDDAPRCATTAGFPDRDTFSTVLTRPPPTAS
ncbi:Uncharacterised protein [Mycobacteroides abscessus subsp. abscessus]|nr:Uncharacterised protein [Mycobacteroides abscessus subsp. abscessus]